MDTIFMGDIGEEIHEIEVLPAEDPYPTEPVVEPVPIAPAEPEKVPA